MKCLWSLLVNVVLFFLLRSTWPNNSVLCISELPLALVTDCVCPGHIATYRCTVQGGLLTVWEGSAFDCPSSEILLTNSDFGTSTAFGVCNNGDIFGRGLTIDGDRYTSELNVTFEPMLQGRTVICSVDNGTHSSRVGHDELHASTDAFPSPTNISLTRVNSTELVFSWNQMQRCPSVDYNIMASDNCGNCPNTSSTSVSCSNFTTSELENTCTFSVRTVICGDSSSPLVGDFSSPIDVNLTVPRIRQLLSVPHYHQDNGLRGITVTFSTLAPFIIFDEIEGSIESYTVTYSEMDSGALCGSQIILANDNHCSVGVCTHEFNVSSSMCPQSTNVSVSVSVTTNLGDGPKADPITEEYQNNYVTVEVVAETTSINCTFPGMMSRGADYSCNATIIYGPNCQNRKNLIGEVITDNLISIGLRSFLAQSGTTRYCRFITNVTADEKFLMVEGNLAFVALLNDQDNSADGAIAAAAIVPAILIIILFSIIMIISVTIINLKRRSKSVHIEQMDMKGLASQQKIPEMHPVDKTCNMIEFAKKKRPSYKPDSGIGYYELQPGSTEYISSTTEVVLINEGKTKVCTGPEARQLVGFRDNTTCTRQPIKMPDDPWTHVFIQCTSLLRELPKGTRFIFYPDNDGSKTQELSSVGKYKEKEEELKLSLVDKKYYTLYNISKMCTLRDFVVKKNSTSIKNLGLGYFFYEFTEPELIPYNKQVILMDQDGELYRGLRAHCEIGLNPDYDEAKERQPPSFKFPEDSRWKKAFISTTSNVRALKPNTQFLYCTIASTEIVEVTEPFKVFKVRQEDEDSRKLIKFARNILPDYNPRAGYGYYEFTEKGFVLPERNVMALKKNEKLYTGPGVRQLIGAAEDYDGTTELPPPTFAESDEWDCIFIQGQAYGRILVKNTRFLYCEYDMPTKE